ncbi:MAG: phage N-6-adenine-methyltransferase [Muribaculaceae bacterium]|nr:phage N-6-adenine-methyltransferase [Muribaculaceae bacterium]
MCKPTDEYYTPLEIVRSLGHFDLDPCAAPGHATSDTLYTKEDDGLTKEWTGRVWLNPPYSQPLLRLFLERMAEHGNGIALLFNRCDNLMFHEIIFRRAAAMRFLRRRIHFIRSDGTRAGSPSCGSVLIAFGMENARILQQSSLEGKFIWLNKTEENDNT